MPERLWTPRQQPEVQDVFLPPSPEEEAAELEKLLAEQRKTRIEAAVRAELEKREVKRLANAAETKDTRRPVRRSLTEELALPDDPEIYAISRLLPIGGNALFAGRYKAGKTTFNANLLRSWADGVPFLGQFQCKPEEDKPVVTIFNYEMSEGQFRRWLRRFRIENLDRIHVVHLRGVSLPLALPEIREEVVSWLKEANTGLWIVDPASRAMTGLGDGSDNADVNVFTAYLDEIKMQAGVRDMVVNIHMGHAASQDKDAERALGAQAWSAWADALWHVTKDKDDLRWFHAYGRDVDVEKMLVRYDDETMSVDLVNTDQEIVRRRQIREAVTQVVRENPGCTQRTIRDHAPALCGGARVRDIRDAVEDMGRQGLLRITPGPNRSNLHYLP